MILQNLLKIIKRPKAIKGSAQFERQKIDFGKKFKKILQFSRIQVIVCDMMVDMIVRETKTHHSPVSVCSKSDTVYLAMIRCFLKQHNRLLDDGKFEGIEGE